MIAQRILILVQDAELKHGLKFPKGTEFEIVADVVYMGGYPISLELQKIIYDWLVANMNNTKMFKDDFRGFK